MNPEHRKEEGSISSVFTSLSGQGSEPLPTRFSDLKKSLWKDNMIQSWRKVLDALQVSVEEISHKREQVPVSHFDRVTCMLIKGLDYPKGEVHRYS